jgi:hypothetical protein
MQVLLTDGAIEVRLSRWQKILGLMRDIRVPRECVSDVRVVSEPLREAMGTGLKFGLRLPWLCYVARTIKLDRAFIVRRGVPALAFAVDDGGPLRHVLVSTPEAEALAARLDGRAVLRRTAAGR